MRIATVIFDYARLVDAVPMKNSNYLVFCLQQLLFESLIFGI